MSKINKIRLSGQTYDIQDSNAYAKSETSGATEISIALAEKQDTLSAGTGIEINGNVISATGGGGSVTVDPSLDSGSTNPVANSAITEAVITDDYTRSTEITGSSEFIAADFNVTPKKVITTPVSDDYDRAFDAYYVYDSTDTEIAWGYIEVESYTAQTISSNGVSAYTNTAFVNGNLEVTIKEEYSDYYFGKISKLWDYSKNIIILGTIPSTAAASAITTNIYPRLDEIDKNIEDIQKIPQITGVSYNNLDSDYGGYLYQELKLEKSDSTNISVLNRFNYSDFKFDENNAIALRTPITVDSALDSTSENPVQNKVIYQAIGDIETLLASI